MAAELRWILGALSVLLLAGIWWWGTRRPKQARGNAELRDPAAPPPQESPGALEAGAREWHGTPLGISPFEPLSIRTADFETIDIVHEPMSAHPAEPLDGQEPDADAPCADALGVTASGDDAAGANALGTDAPAAGPRSTTAAPPPAERAAAPTAETTHPALPRANLAEVQRIITLRVSAAGAEQWPGLDLLTALEEHGLAHGRYQVFHRKHSDGRTLFCAASLVEPGTFDPAKMPHETYRGLTLFAVLPGPIEPLHTVETLIDTAVALARSLRGTVQDAQGASWSPERAAALREDVARFQALLAG